MPRLSFVAIGLALGVASGAVAVENYPSRPVRIIVPFPAGQATDILARFVGQSLSEKFSVGFPVDNRSGAGGIVGMEAAANAAPDGYTLLVTPSGTLAINPYIYSKLPYDPVKSFEPVSLLGLLPLVLVVHPSVQANSVQELVALAKAKPGTINYASSGAGSAQHLAAELFKWRSGTQMMHIPYRGSAPAITDLLAGRVQFMFDTVASALPNIQSGSLRALAVTTMTRSSALPEVPTMDEAGLANFEAVGWAGMLAPAGVPADIVRRLNAETAKALQQPDIRARVIALGMEPAPNSPAEFAAFIKVQMAKWQQAVTISGIQMDK